MAEAKQKAPARPAAKRSTATKRPVRRRTAAKSEQGPGYVHSIFGPFGSQALVVMPSERAHELVAAGKVAPAPAFLIDAVAREILAAEEKMPGAASSALAATATALAMEISSPAARSTAKPMLAARLMEAMDRLAALVPAEAESDGLDELKLQREKRIAGAKAATG